MTTIQGENIIRQYEEGTTATWRTGRQIRALHTGVEAVPAVILGLDARHLHSRHDFPGMNIMRHRLAGQRLGCEP